MAHPLKRNLKSLQDTVLEGTAVNLPLKRREGCRAFLCGCCLPQMFCEQEEKIMTRTNKNIQAMVITAVLLAIGMVLPFITGQIQAIGAMISPLHIPVLICGLTCGWQWGLALGVILPILRGLVFGMPPFPTQGLPMAFELGAYGLLAGMLYVMLLKKKLGTGHLPAMLAALVLAMIGGRIIGGAAKGLLLMFGLIGSKAPYTFSAFITSYFVATAPGAVIHLILVPAIVTALERAKLSPLLQNGGFE